MRSGLIDLFPKDKNRETEVIAASVSFLSLTLFEAINSENNLHYICEFENKVLSLQLNQRRGYGVLVVVTMFAVANGMRY